MIVTHWTLVHHAVKYKVRKRKWIKTNAQKHKYQDFNLFLH